MVDVTQDFDLFATALRTLVPIFDRSGIRWKNVGQYDEFYHIADGLFSGLITSKFSDDERYSSKFEPYAYCMKKDGVARFIVTDVDTGDDIGDFVRFVSNILPFDSIEVDNSRELVTIPFSMEKFRIVTE
ncbi:MAG TPA: hypothetical protein VEX35_14175 [Allosphingosinicella sp.]|nr:hypothetical protein [Allosphingosinicella sp.]